MKETMIMNVGVMFAASIAISTACKVTRSAWPLLGFLLVPKWYYQSSENRNSKGD